MEEFKNYLASEYQVNDAAAIDMKCTHNMNVKIDKTSKVPVNVHSITVALKFYDKEMKLLKSGSVKFVNNEIPKSQEKKLVNIAPAELNNKFMAVRPLIIKSIMSEYAENAGEIKDKIASLKLYAGKDNDSVVVDDQFKGKLVQPANVDPIDVPKKVKKQFDM